MSEQTSRDRRQRLFHRLVGALVLTALAIIVLPMILDFRADYDTAITRSNIPERPAGLRMEEIPLQAPVRPTPAPAASTPASASAPASPPAEAVNEAAPPATPAAVAEAPRQPPPVAAAPAVPSAAKGWVVRVGSFSSAENAQGLRDQLRAKGYAAFVDQAAIDGKTMWRVHVGPEAQRERGDALRDRIERDMKLNAIVVAHE